MGMNKIQMTPNPNFYAHNMILTGMDERINGVVHLLDSLPKVVNLILNDFGR